MIDVIYFLIGILVLLFLIAFVFLSKDVFKTGVVKVHKVKIKDKESFWISAIFLVIFFALAIGEFIKLRPATNYISYVGVVLIFVGGLIRILARKELDRFFSFEVVIQKGHKLVTKGIYKSVRHPMALGLALELVGLSLALRSKYSLLVLIVFGTVVLLYRINAEEKLLIKEFGKDYLEYMEHTKKLIPKMF
ncbi:isoprenylcysteine carboxylmethyltransferase family protein [Candidatus Woesearchaeota archaeon]|nr:isoprenylcysteine carboxylmethyltransferase family protein [Candidatus Woesearchaeota archaeon]